MRTTIGIGKLKKCETLITCHFHDIGPDARLSAFGPELDHRTEVGSRDARQLPTLNVL